MLLLERWRPVIRPDGAGLLDRLRCADDSAMNDPAESLGPTAKSQGRWVCRDSW